MENLLRQREDLLEQIRRIAETCEGLENDANARRVTELNGRQAELLAQKDELKNKLSSIDGELGTIGKNISDLSGSGLEKILQAIKNQRWFFFANKPKVLMDRDTALLWADLNYFPYNNGSSAYHKNDAYPLVQKLFWADYSNWKFPTYKEICFLVDDKTFPFMEGSNWKIKGNNWWFAFDGNYNMIDLNSKSKHTYDSSASILPCNDSLVPPDYENNISPSNNFYTEKEKLQFTLNIFVQNDLIPMFNNAEITQLYRKIFIEKPALMKQLAEVEAQIAEAGQVKLTANFDYRALLAHYDTAALDKSPIKYFDALSNMTDEFLNVLEEYETAQAETIAEFSKVAGKLKAKYAEDPNLTPEENYLFAERQKFLARRLEIDTDAPKQKILFVKTQAKNFFTRLEVINSDNNSIRELAELQAEPRADFELVVENLARIILDTQRRVDFFAAHKDFVSSIAETQTAWSDNYRSFKTALRGELKSICTKENINEKICDAWCDDWQARRFAIEQRFLPLIEFALRGKFADVVGRVLKVLQSYREAVDKFYMQERKNIYQKFASQAGGDSQEKIETESALYKLAAKLQHASQGIIFSLDKTEERIFLLKWSEPLLDLPLDELCKFTRDDSFAALKRQNFSTYLADSKTYSESIQRRENEFNALISKVRKSLQ